MTDELVKVLHAYLAVREPTSTNHLLVCRLEVLHHLRLSTALRSTSRYPAHVSALPEADVGTPVRASGQYINGYDSSPGAGLLTLAVQSTKLLWAGQRSEDMSESYWGGRPPTGERSGWMERVRW